jgi:hypothetical protein
MENGWKTSWETFWVVAATIAASGCAIEPEVAVRTSAGETCPEWGCGQNSPIMGPWRFHELNTDHVPNSKGIRIRDFYKGGNSYQLQISGSRLTATGEGPELTGSDLAGGSIRLDTGSGASPEADYQIHITRVSPVGSSVVRFWVGPPDRIETYELVYTGPGTSTVAVPLCNNPPDRSTAGGETWPRPLEAILYTGDRYDSRNKLVTAATYAGSAGWFNIACAGSALAKLHLTRHTTAGSAPGYSSSAAQRQAMLKMYVSDLCGTGRAWTRKGTPLHWVNAPRWQQLDGTEFAQEALWTEQGALCLDVHRLGALYDNTDGFRGECRLPACPRLAPGAVPPRPAYVLSAVPEDPDAPPNPPL